MCISDEPIALQALLSSLGQSSSQNGSKLPADQVKKLSEKLEELMGNVGPADLSQPRNERGEVCRMHFIQLLLPLRSKNSWSMKRDFRS